MRTKETGRKAIGFEYPHGSDEWLKSRVLKLCKHGSVRRGREAYAALPRPKRKMSLEKKVCIDPIKIEKKRLLWEDKEP